MTQHDKARLFRELHVKGAPLILYNVWDAGSARAVEAAGAKAIATGSWSVAGAQGFKDGQAIPLDLLETIVVRIVRSVDGPVSVDFEGGYGELPEAVAKNVARIIETGAIGINFEDQMVGGEGLYSVETQSRRVAAIRRKADEMGVSLVINARTDLFLKTRDPTLQAQLISKALARASAYREAGADSFFVPGLADERLIAAICDGCPLPVNVMMSDHSPAMKRLADVGVARISYGPAPFVNARKTLENEARRVFRSE
ncbi:MAG: isocitrate lyase/phosphoenolpyruvate mutase family protein [Beijerinckiaceae bacterium]|nr:isocitrate lyase/phosphoenolpyruvate mutase family protein [Beijerinckiaceae bacterium]